MSYNVENQLEAIQAQVVQIPNFPSKGVVFQSLEKCFLNPESKAIMMSALAMAFADQEIDVVCGIESRGLPIAADIATILHAGYVAIRKASGKLGGDCVEQEYGTEYSKDKIKMSSNSIQPGQRVLIVDDLAASGGSAEAASKLVAQLGGIVVGFAFVIELVGLGAFNRLSLPNNVIHSLFRFDSKTGKPLHSWFESRKRMYKALDECEYKTSKCRMVYDKDMQLTVEGDMDFDKKMDESSTPTITSSSTFTDRQPTLFVNQDPTYKNDFRTIVFYCESMKGLAQDIVKGNPSKYRLGKIDWGKFPDGTPKVFFEHKNNMQGRDVMFIMSMKSMEHILTQLMMIMVLPKQHVKSLHVIVSYFAFGCQERFSCEGELATADTMCKLLTEGLPQTQQGPAQVTIVDMHALQSRFYFSNNSCIHFVSALELFKKRIHAMREKVAIVMCDDGCYKRYKNMVMDEFPTLIFNKVRNGNTRKMILKDSFLPSSTHSFSTSDDGNVLSPDIHYIMIDDLCSSGATLNECRKKLVEMGATKVSAYVTHAVFPNKAYEKFMPGGDFAGLQHFFVMDTVPETTDVIKKYIGLYKDCPFEVLSCAELFTSHNDDKLSKSSSTSTSSSSIAHSLTTKFSKLPYCVFVGSKSKVKMDAVARIGCPRMSSVETSSGVPDQPFGLFEIWTGAINRMHDLLSKDPNNCIQVNNGFVTMENGIYKNDDDSFVDIACVIFYSKQTNRMTVKWSIPVAVPKGVMDQWIQNGRKETVGKLIQSLGLSNSHDNWHKDFKMDRSIILARTLLSAIETNGAYQY